MKLLFLDGPLEGQSRPLGDNPLPASGQVFDVPGHRAGKAIIDRYTAGPVVEDVMVSRFAETVDRDAAGRPIAKHRYQLGDVVSLQSGGPKMTVIGLEDRRGVLCVVLLGWAADGGPICSATTPEVAVIRYGTTAPFE